MRTGVVVLALAAMLPGATSARAASARLDFHVADAFLTDLTGVPQTGARAQTADAAHVIRFSGSGAFVVGSAAASGGGVWAHTSGTDGDLFAFGTWTATAPLSFEPFGCGGDGIPATACGGILELAVHLSGTHVSIGPEEVDGVLTIVSGIGPDAPAGIEDAIAFTPMGVPIDFVVGLSDPGGATLFGSKSAA